MECRSVLKFYFLHPHTHTPHPFYFLHPHTHTPHPLKLKPKADISLNILSLFEIEELLLKNLKQLSYLLNQSSSYSILSKVNNSTSKISRLIENLPTEEDFFQTAINLIYIQSFYNLTENDMAKVSIDRLSVNTIRICFWKNLREISQQKPQRVTS